MIYITIQIYINIQIYKLNYYLYILIILLFFYFDSQKEKIVIEEVLESSGIRIKPRAKQFKWIFQKNKKFKSSIKFKKFI